MFATMLRAPRLLVGVVACLCLGLGLGLGPVPVAALYENGSVIAPCDSPLYCQGDILHQIELARPYSDSKTFVDL